MTPIEVSAEQSDDKLWKQGGLFFSTTEIHEYFTAWTCMCSFLYHSKQCYVQSILCAYLLLSAVLLVKYNW